MCFAKKVKEVCGEKQSEVMYFVSRAMARNIAKSQKKTCPGKRQMSKKRTTVEREKNCALNLDLM